MNYLSVLTTLVTIVFMVSVFLRFLRRRSHPYLLVWSFGLLLYGLGTISEVVLSLTFSPLMLKIWYLSGAMLTAAWLGQGTVFLLIRRRYVAPTLAVILGLASIASIVLILTAPITSAASGFQIHTPVSAQYQDILVRSGAVTALTIFLNIYGTICLIGGAIFSGFLFWRKRILPNRVLGNVLIAIGAMSPAMAGSFIKLGLNDMLYVSELLGVVLMYLGFLQASYRRKTATSKVQTPTHEPSSLG